MKAIRRKTTGSGRMRYLKTVDRKFKNGFREGAPSFEIHYCDVRSHLVVHLPLVCSIRLQQELHGCCSCLTWPALSVMSD